MGEWMDAWPYDPLTKDLQSTRMLESERVATLGYELVMV